VRPFNILNQAIMKHQSVKNLRLFVIMKLRNGKSLRLFVITKLQSAKNLHLFVIMKLQNVKNLRLHAKNQMSFKNLQAEGDLKRDNF
jgi:GTPase Era involved in 16S rRNA processing